jgi:DNA polymerase IIIc chi subunit
MSVGKSIPKMNAIVLATPRKNKSRQIINRIFRLGSNYDIERQIVDIVDKNTIFNKNIRHRMAYYREKNYSIEHLTVRGDAQS